MRRPESEPAPELALESEPASMSDPVLETMSEAERQAVFEAETVSGSEAVSDAEPETSSDEDSEETNGGGSQDSMYAFEHGIALPVTRMERDGRRVRVDRVLNQPARQPDDAGALVALGAGVPERLKALLGVDRHPRVGQHLKRRIGDALDVGLGQRPVGGRGYPWHFMEWLRQSRSSFLSPRPAVALGTCWAAMTGSSHV